MFAQSSDTPKVRQFRSDLCTQDLLAKPQLAPIREAEGSPVIVVATIPDGLSMIGSAASEQILPLHVFHALQRPVASTSRCKEWEMEARNLDLLVLVSRYSSPSPVRRRALF